jgi:hypothetical protein
MTADLVELELAGGYIAHPEDAWASPDLTLLREGRRPAPHMPVSLLGPFWEEWAISRARAASAPADYTGTALLACAGAALGNVRWPVAGAGWSESPVLWCALVGSPSAGKSPAMDAAFDLIRHAEDCMASGFDADRAIWETNRQVGQARKEAWQAEIRTAVHGGGTIPLMPTDIHDHEPPVRPRIRVADATTEKLGALAAALPRGLLLVRDELSGWLGGFDKYGGRGSDRAFALEMYGGRAYVVDRMKNPEPLRIRHLSIGVLGGIQPDKIAGVTAGPDDGLVSRLLWTWPELRPGFTLDRTPQNDTTPRQRFARLTELEMGADEFGNPEPKRVQLETCAEDVLEKFARDMAEQGVDAAGIFAGSLGKARGHVLRLSLILEHLWWCGAPGKAPPASISVKAVEAAAAFVQAYFLPMAERVYGDAAIPPAERGAIILVRHLRRNGLREFNGREMRRQIGGTLRDPAPMRAACATLIEAGLIRTAFSRASSKPGRVAQRYEVNPAVHVVGR